MFAYITNLQQHDSVLSVVKELKHILSVNAKYITYLRVARTEHFLEVIIKDFPTILKRRM